MTDDQKFAHKLIQRGKNFGSVFVRLDRQPNLFDAAVTADEESHAMCAEIFTSHESLFAPNAISFNNFFVFIGEQRERQFEFLDEFVVRLYGIRADAEHNRTAFFE